MANLSIKVDLLKIQGACVTNLKGKTATKRCLIIPVDDAHLYVGQKGCYLDLTAIEMQNSQYGDSHCVKQNLPKDIFEAMTEEERRAQPIIGSMKPITRSAQAINAQNIIECEDDMPF